MIFFSAISEERLAEAFDRIDADDSGFISAENLKALLGNDFPEDEIDAIIQEAGPTKEGKISYSEFLALWEDKNETKHLQDIHEIRELAGKHESERSSLFSTSEEGEDEEEDPVDVAARANFLEEKRHSERKSSESEVNVEASGGDGHKHVGFREDVHTIPTVTYVEGDGVVMNDDSETMKLKETN